jgi:hypothetical protein
MRVRGNSHVGQAVLQEPFLNKSTSLQLALLSDDQYPVGLSSIEHVITDVSVHNEKIVFSSDIHVQMFWGNKP